MKNLFLGLSLAASLASSTSAFAFGEPVFEFGGQLVAKKACPDLGISENDILSIAAEYSLFQLLQQGTDGSSVAPKVLFRYSVPDQGSYTFEGQAPSQSTHEFVTNNIHGADNYRYVAHVGTGSVDILHFGPNPTTRCHLSQPAFHE